MSFYTMAKTLTGEVPQTALALVQTKIQEGLGKVFDAYDWSFQTEPGGWYCPGLLANTGTFTVQPFSNVVIADATATMALAAITGMPLITQLQYRDPARALYSIVGYNTTTNFPFATLTLDRPWMESSSGPGQPYMIYQAYFAAPWPDFRRFIEVRDTTTRRELDFWSFSQSDLAREDPQRTRFSDPRFVVPFGVDKRAGSSTAGFMLFELWPQQLARLPYSFEANRRGPMLVLPDDTLPYPLTEDLVKWAAKEELYLFKEAQKTAEEERGAGANWQFLVQYAKARYTDSLNFIEAIDINLHNDALNKVVRPGWDSQQPYANRLGGVNIGGYPQ
jgi:hypothetical protein